MPIISRECLASPAVGVWTPARQALSDGHGSHHRVPWLWPLLLPLLLPAVFGWARILLEISRWLTLEPFIFPFLGRAAVAETEPPFDIE